MKVAKSVSPNILNYLLAVLSVFAAGGAFYLFRAYLDDKHDESLLFLPVVIACALRLGFGPAVTASVFAVVLWDYFFIPPRFTLTIGRPGDGIDLGAFLVAAITTSQIAAQARRTAQQASLREREIATLYNIGQIVNSEIESDRILYTMAEQIAENCLATRCLVFRADGDGKLLEQAASSDRASATQGASETIAQRSVYALAESALLRARSAPPTEPHGFSGRENRGDGRSRLAEELTEPVEQLTVGEGVGAGIYLPLQDGDETVGVLFVGPRVDAEVRDSYDKRLVAALGNYAATVLARQHIADQSRQRVRNAAKFEERNRLAREIHDTLAQGLTGIVIQLQAADGGSPEDQWAAVTQAKRLAQECLTEARRSVKALRPGALEGRDLPTALSEMLTQTTQATSIEGSFVTIGSPYALPDEIDSNLLRIGQEAVTNTIRHSVAHQIRVTLTYGATQVQLRIVDDGCGFDPDSVEAHGFGLISMRERAEQLGAQLEILSDMNSGTSIAVNITVSKTLTSGTRLADLPRSEVKGSHDYCRHKAENDQRPNRGRPPGGPPGPCRNHRKTGRHYGHSPVRQRPRSSRPLPSAAARRRPDGPADAGARWSWRGFGHSPRVSARANHHTDDVRHRRRYIPGPSRRRHGIPAERRSTRRTHTDDTRGLQR